jgi:drug/metabolite transporter (DMT)-like permease
MALEGSILIGLIIGIFAYVIEYIGKGIQKYSIEGWKVDKSLKSKHTGYFIIGTIMTSLYVFIQWAALIFAPVNLIAALEGIGLVVLIIFSYFVLKEKISNKQIIGIILILIGTVFITFFSANTDDIQYDDFNLTSFNFFSLAIIIVEIAGILASRYNNYKAAGLIIGFTAGTFMALQTVTKRITAIPDPVLTLVFTFLSFGVTLLTFLFTQIAFAKAKANIVIPCFISASIIIAILIGVIALSEEIILIQVFGIVIVVIGVILLTAFRESNT